jgi:hypothetical protein
MLRLSGPQKQKKTHLKIQPFTGAPVIENLFLDNNLANRLAEFAMMSHLFRVTISFMARGL